MLFRALIVGRVVLAGGPRNAAATIRQPETGQDRVVFWAFAEAFSRWSTPELKDHLSALDAASRRPREQIMGWDTWQETEWRVLHEIETAAVLVVLESRAAGSIDYGRCRDIGMALTALIDDWKKSAKK